MRRRGGRRIRDSGSSSRSTSMRSRSAARATASRVESSRVFGRWICDRSQSRRRVKWFARTDDLRACFADSIECRGPACSSAFDIGEAGRREPRRRPYWPNGRTEALAIKNVARIPSTRRRSGTRSKSRRAATYARLMERRGELTDLSGARTVPVKACRVSDVQQVTWRGDRH